MNNRKTIFGLMTVLFATAFILGATDADAQREITTGLLGDDILEMEVRTRNGEEVGDIEDIIFDKNGRIDKFIVDVGGFLGIGGKKVAVSKRNLKYNETEGFAEYQGTRNDLENMEEADYSENQYGYGYAPGRAYYRPYYDPYRTPGYRDPYYSPRYPRTYGYDPTQDEERMQGRYMAPREERMERDRYMEQGRDDGGMGMMRREQRPDQRRYLRGQDEIGMSRMDRRMEHRPYMDRMGRGETGRGYYQSSMRTGELPMERLMDATVRTRNGDTVGGIENLIVDRRGRISHVVMDVGGFLGIGDKRVAVPFDRLENVGPYYVMYPGTENELENLPEFDPDRDLGESRGWRRSQREENPQKTE